MSVDRTVYLAYGVEVPYKKLDAIVDAHESDFDWYDEFVLGNVEHGKVGFLLDGMGGNYALVGAPVASLGEYEDGGIEKIDVYTPKQKADIKKQIEEFLGESVGKLGYLMVDHYH